MNRTSLTALGNETKRWLRAFAHICGVVRRDARSKAVNGAINAREREFYLAAPSINISRICFLSVFEMRRAILRSGISKRKEEKKKGKRMRVRTFGEFSGLFVRLLVLVRSLLRVDFSELMLRVESCTNDNTLVFAFSIT